MSFDNAPAQYHLDYQRIKNMVTPFELRHPDCVGSYDKICVNCILFGSFIDWIILDDIEAGTKEKVRLYLMMEVQDRINNMEQIGDKLNTVHQYLRDMCDYEPLKWPDPEEFDKYKLVESLR